MVVLSYFSSYLLSGEITMLLKKNDLYYCLSNSDKYNAINKIKLTIQNNSDYRFRYIEKKDSFCFEISKCLIMKNSFNPILYGTMNENEDDVIITGRFGVNRIVSILLLYASAISILILCMTLSSREPVEIVVHMLNESHSVYAPWWVPSAFTIGFILLISLFIIIGVKLQQSKREDIEKLLTNILLDYEAERGNQE